MRRPQLAVVTVTLACSASSIAQLRLHEHVGDAFDHRLGTSLAAAGDVDADGVQDYMASSFLDRSPSQGYVRVWSGRDGRLLHEFRGTGDGWGLACASAGDVDADGHSDVLIGAPATSRGDGACEVRSGATGFLLRRLTGPSGMASYFGARMAPLGDVDGDGHGDFVVLASQVGTVHVISGQGFTELFTQTASSGPFGSDDGTLVSIGDVNGDGTSDFAYGNPRFNSGMGTDGQVIVYSGRGGQIRRLDGIGGSSERFGIALAGGADLDGDGVDDLLVAARYSQDPVTGLGTGAVYAHSGRTGARLLTSHGGFTESWGRGLAFVGDLNLDGVPEIAVAAPFQDVGEVHVLDGRTLEERMDLRGEGIESLGASLACVPDVNGDGFDELLVASPGYDRVSLNQGRVQLISGRIQVNQRALDGACGGGPFLPRLGATRPILGGSLSIAGRDVPSGLAGTLIVGLPLSPPLPLGFPGCSLHVNPTAGFLVATPPTTSWDLLFPLPMDPSVAGMALTAQAAYAPTLGALGFDLSNAVWMRVGY